MQITTILSESDKDRQSFSKGVTKIKMKDDLKSINYRKLKLQIFPEILIIGDRVLIIGYSVQ